MGRQIRPNRRFVVPLDSVGGVKGIMTDDEILVSSDAVGKTKTFGEESLGRNGQAEIEGGTSDDGDVHVSRRPVSPASSSNRFEPHVASIRPQHPAHHRPVPRMMRIEFKSKLLREPEKHGVVVASEPPGADQAEVHDQSEERQHAKQVGNHGWAYRTKPHEPTGACCSCQGQWMFVQENAVNSNT